MDVLSLPVQTETSRKGLEREGKEGNKVTFLLDWKIKEGTERRFIDRVLKLHYKGMELNRIFIIINFPNFQFPSFHPNFGGNIMGF